MLNYIDQIVVQLRHRFSEIPNDETPYDLLRFYALLVLVREQDIDARDVHDAWSAWRTHTAPNHKYLIPFDELTPKIQALDEPYVRAIREVARDAI